jgi:hypothetical protein
MIEAVRALKGVLFRSIGNAGMVEWSEPTLPEFLASNPFQG